MEKYTRYWYAALASVVVLSACGEKPADDNLAEDLQLAGADSAAPALTDVPAAAEPAPAATPAPRPAPRPAPSRPATTASGNTRTSGPAERAMGTIAAGSTLNLASNTRVCTNTQKVGDVVYARLTQSVSGSNGAVIPAGSNVALEITELKRSENANDKIRMGFAVRAVYIDGKTYPLSATVTSASVTEVANQPKGKDAQKVATGAVAGAILGRVLGKDTKGAVIGGAVGAAAGAGVAAATGNKEGCVVEGGSIVVALSNAVQVPA